MSSYAWMASGRVSTGLGVGASGGVAMPATEPGAVPAVVEPSIPTDDEAMSSSREVAASSLRSTVVSVLRPTTTGGWAAKRPGSGLFGIKDMAVLRARCPHAELRKRIYPPLYKSRQIVHVVLVLCHDASTPTGSCGRAGLAGASRKVHRRQERVDGMQLARGTHVRSISVNNFRVQRNQTAAELRWTFAASPVSMRYLCQAEAHPSTLHSLCACQQHHPHLTLSQKRSENSQYGR